MHRLFVIAMCAVCFAPASSYGVDIKNIRPCYGPLGATRYEAKCLPGDVLFMTYDLEGLAVDKTTGKASYVTILELIDSDQKVLFKKETPNDVMPQLGGTRMPGDLHVIMAPKQAPGKYFIKLTVHDKLGKDAKAFKYDFVVMPETFGIVGVSAPAIGFPGQHYVTGFGLVNLALDKMNQPKANVSIRILDAAGAAVTTPVQMVFPQDLPMDTDLSKGNFVPLTFPIYLNRVGRFTVEVIATDVAGNRKAELRYPMTVIDLNTFTGK